MKQASRKSRQENHFYQFSLRMREGFMIISGSLAIFLLISFLTFHYGDPGWSSTGNGNHVANAGGYVGAWLADILLYFFGYLAYAFPFLLIYWGWHMVRAGYIEIPQTWRQLLPFRLLGFFTLLLTGCGFLSLQFHIHIRIPYESGGIIGTIIAQLFSNQFNTAGASILLLGLLCLGLMFLTGMSWLKLSERVGILILKLVQYFQEMRRRRRKAALTAIKPQSVVRLEPGLADISLQTHTVTKAESLITKDIAHTKNLSQDDFKPYDDDRDEAHFVSPLPTKSPKMNTKQKNREHYSLIEGKASNTLSPEVKENHKPNYKIHEPVIKQVPITRFIADLSEDGELPSLALLDQPEATKVQQISHESLENMSREVEMRLKEFGIDVRVVAVHPGPVITRFEMQLAPGLKVSRISGLAKDLARSLSVTSVRIVEVIAGKSVVGLEVPNESRETVRLSEILSSSQYSQMRSPLALSLGKDIAGHPVVVDLAKMPHLLVAGTTGSGKSVGVNAMLLGLLYKSTPKDIRMILVDPKMLELSIYEGIPHLLTPVVTDMKEAANALRWCVAEMERRYRLMAGLGVRNLASFNQKVKEALERNEPLKDPTWRGPAHEEAPVIEETLPYIVVVIDEFADMMMVVGKKVEQLIARIAQKARAAGIHLILATQRPSVDVITGLIKANIPTRIAFQVSSKIDSRTVLDQGGAEQLLGQGDMLYLPPGTSMPVRVHGAFVADDEVHRVVEDWKSKGEPDYIDEITSEVSDGGSAESEGGQGEAGDESDPLYNQAVHIVTLTRRASISNLQRRLKIGYNRAARLIEEMEMSGIVSSMESNGSREVLAPPPPE